MATANISMYGASYYDPNDLPGQQSCNPVPIGSGYIWSMAQGECGSVVGGHHMICFYSSLSDCLFDVNRKGVSILNVFCDPCVGVCDKDEEEEEGG